MTDLYLVGSGLQGTLHFTVETLQALRLCKRVYVLHDDLHVHAYLRSFCPDVRDLAAFYAGAGLRVDVYRRIADTVVSATADCVPIGFLAHGHPLFLVSAVEYMLDRARRVGASVRVLPAVSSFDTILCNLLIDFGYAIQVFDATTLLERDLVPEPRVPLLVFQIATTLRSEVVLQTSTEALHPLVHHLLRAYPASHHCKLVHTATGVFEGDLAIDCTIQSLPERAEGELWRRPTLYVPPVERVL